MSLRLSREERQTYDRDGFIVRRGTFGREDIEALRTAAEELVADVQRSATAIKRRHGSYTFQTHVEQALTVKWESGKSVVLGLEPFVHLSPVFKAYAADDRFTEPMKDLTGSDEVTLYTEKLNMKRAGVGGPIVLHQDWPYWRNIADDVERIVTAMLFLDDANVESGCLEVAPGSHVCGVQPTRDAEGFPGEIDYTKYDLATLVPVEVRAGDMVMFGPRLVHRSMPNTSAMDRRALLYSYQPSQYRHCMHFLRQLRTAGQPS
jgi:phytanoyl-CoA hydroxylase